MWAVTKPLSHFPALLIFAALASLALACLAHRDAPGRAKYFVGSLILFVLIAVGFAWAMYPLSR